MAQSSNPTTRVSRPLRAIFRAGELIYAEGDPNGEVYEVETGKVEILRARGGEETAVAVHAKGSGFGEPIAGENGLRTTTARAVDETIVLVKPHAARPSAAAPKPASSTQTARRGVLNRKVFYPGDVLLTEGAVATTAFLIESGEVEVFRTVNCDEIPLATIGAGAIVGEMALIDDQPRMATARAKTQTVAIVLGRGVFETKLEEADPFISKILKVFLKNIRTRTKEYAVTKSKLDELDRASSTDPEDADPADAKDDMTITLGMIEVGQNVYEKWTKDLSGQRKANAATNLICDVYKAMEKERRVFG